MKDKKEVKTYKVKWGDNVAVTVKAHTVVEAVQKSWSLGCGHHYNIQKIKKLKGPSLTRLKGEE